MTHLPDFDRALDTARETLISRYQDYGPENITEAGEMGVADRLTDKLNRIKTLTQSGQPPRGESKTDTWIDIMGYGAIGWLLDQGLWPTGGELLESQPINWVYLAGPIDGSDDPNTWRKAAAKLLSQWDISSYSPAGAFTWCQEADPRVILNVNRMALNQCDAVLFNLLSNTPTLGTGREIEWALQDSKHITIARKPTAPWAYLYDLPNHFFSIEDACEYLGFLNE